MVSLLLSPSPVMLKPAPGIYIFSRNFAEDNWGVKAEREPYETPAFDKMVEVSTLPPGARREKEVEINETDVFTPDANRDPIKGASSAANWKHQIFFK